VSVWAAGGASGSSSSAVVNDVVLCHGIHHQAPGPLGSRQGVVVVVGVGVGVGGWLLLAKAKQGRDGDMHI
jgi:hypothetical protein